MQGVKMRILIIVLLLLVGCETDPGSIEITDEVFVLPGCVEERRLDKDAVC